MKFGSVDMLIILIGMVAIAGIFLIGLSLFDAREKGAKIVGFITCIASQAMFFFFLCRILLKLIEGI